MDDDVRQNKDELDNNEIYIILHDMTIDLMKWKSILRWGMFIAFFYAVAGCSVYSKEGYLDDFENFVSDVEANYDTYSGEDWELKDDAYQEYVGENYERYKAQLTDEDLHLIGKLQGRYLAVKIKYEAGTVADKVAEGVKQLEGIIEGLTESFGNQ
jgi:hypothetical protein